MRRILLVVSVVLVTVVGSAVAGVASGDDGIVEIRGKDSLQINQSIRSTLSFHHGEVEVAPGASLTWIDADEVDQPHTITVVDETDLPTTIDDIFMCAVCEAALGAHFGGGSPVPVVDPGGDGLNGTGDSLLVLPGVFPDAMATVTAPAGTTLFYLCAVHPWMQGSILVEETD